MTVLGYYHVSRSRISVPINFSYFHCYLAAGLFVLQALSMLDPQPLLMAHIHAPADSPDGRMSPGHVDQMVVSCHFSYFEA